ncbi:MAG: hypothetical protein J5521_09885 [Lachnospiraceae bacterium]|nr:hypothetical protein [Lachnospiraceae bacterium]
MARRKTDAEKRAQKRYDEVHKNEFVNYHLKVRKDGNELIIQKLKTVDKKQTYILELIREDIRKNGI